MVSTSRFFFLFVGIVFIHIPFCLPANLYNPSSKYAILLPFVLTPVQENRIVLFVFPHLILQYQSIPQIMDIPLTLF